MIINGHDQGRRDAFFPGVVAEGLAEGMAADRPFQIQLAYRLLDDPKGIGSDDRLIETYPAFKDITQTSHIDFTYAP